MGGFINIVLTPLETVFKPILNVFKTIVVLIQLLVELIKMLPKFFYIFNYLLDPSKIISDSIYGFTTGLKLIFMTTLDTIQGKSINLIKPHIEDDDPVNSKREKEDCLGPSVLEILLLLLCPPLAIFIRKGLKGFFTIVITAVFTYFYYLPGLIYASLYVL